MSHAELSAYAFGSALPVPLLAHGNRLLESLPEADGSRWKAQLEIVRLRTGQTLATSGTGAPYVYLPIDCLVSLVYLTTEGSSTEIALVGNEGLVGMNLFMGETTGASQAIVQCAGLAYRMKAAFLGDEFLTSPGAQQLLLRYLQSVLAQSAQLAVCNRHHTVKQQLARWLLSALDRQPTMTTLNLTQESIANALGVRRAGVTEAASKLRIHRIVDCRRGRISVIDRAGLEHHACECYSAMRREHQRLAPPARVPGLDHLIHPGHTHSQAIQTPDAANGFVPQLGGPPQKRRLPELDIATA